MHTVWWVANVTACIICAIHKTTRVPAHQAVKLMRNTITPAQTMSQADKLKRGNHRLWVKNQTISVPTDTAHKMPIMVLLYPKASKYKDKKTYTPICANTWKNTLAKNQRTLACFSTPKTGGEV